MTRHPPAAALRPRRFTLEELARLTAYGAAWKRPSTTAGQGGEALPTPRSLQPVSICPDVRPRPNGGQQK